MPKPDRDPVVVDASAFVDLLSGTPVGPAVERRLRDQRLVAPGHFDAEVLSALGRLHRSGDLTEAQVGQRLDLLTGAPVDRRPLPPLLRGAWRRRHNLRLVDALYAELSAQLDDAALLTTDAGMAAAHPTAELIVA